MLALRLQRTGRKKLAQYRLIAQEHSLSPKSGKVVAYLGSYDPHTKKAAFDKEAVEKHLKNGAKPSNRVALILKRSGITLPDWVTIETKEPKKEAATEETEDDTAGKDTAKSEAETEDTKESESEQPKEEDKKESKEAAKDSGKEESSKAESNDKKDA